MRKRLLAAGILLASAVPTASFASDLFDRITAGRYQAILSDCAACHTAPGAAPYSGGAPLVTPFGNIVPSNITPDRETGIGAWTFEQFRSAVKKGIGRHGERLYPAMPYPAYSLMSDSDVADLWAYMQRIEPVKNRVVSNQLPFPFNIRLSLIGWNLLNFRPREFAADSSKSAEWNRGAYLVLGAGHCGACHTPKTLTGGDKGSQFLQGANLQNWVAPNISADPHKGIGSWDTADIIAYLKTGVNRFEIASGPMAEVVTNSTQFWTDDDLKSAATFLKDSKGGSATKPAPLRAEDPAMIAGRAIYADRCAACHVGNGEGAPFLFPRLAQAPLINSDDPTSLIRVVLEGSQAGATAARPTGPAMPSLAWNLSNDEVANVLTYIRNSWGNAAPPVTASGVKSLRSGLTR